MKNKLLTILLFAIFSTFAAAQVPSTERSVTTLPATCKGGNAKVPTDKIVLITASVGREYICTATNVWTPTTLTIATGATAMSVSPISSTTCATVSISATGVLVTDTLSVSFNGDPTGAVGYMPSTNGMLTIFPYPTTNNVNFKVCNNTTNPVTPGAVTLNWMVTR